MSRRAREYCFICKQHFWSDYEEQPECPNGCDENEEAIEEDVDEEEPETDEAAEFGGVDIPDSRY